MFDGLFGESGGDSLSAVANFNSRYGWYQSVHTLSGGDITKFEEVTRLNVYQCLYALQYEKEKNELEAQQIKRNFKK